VLGYVGHFPDSVALSVITHDEDEEKRQINDLLAQYREADKQARECLETPQFLSERLLRRALVRGAMF
jgi:hypothetical protein